MAERNGTTFTDLTKELAHLSKIDGMSVLDGVQDMYGRDLTVTEEELPDYIANTQRVLNSTKDTNGEIVGLPIDMANHDHQGGAGWIVGLELDEARKIINFLVEWTEDGVEAIASNITRYFSPSFDDENKIILGGSLTNWPGSRNQKGQYLLRPVELSKSMQSIKEIKMTVPEATASENKSVIELLTTLPARIVEAMTPKKPETPTTPEAPAPAELQSKSITELLKTPEAIEELGRLAEEQAKDLTRTAMRKKHVIEFAASIVGGTPERPFGLAVRANEIVGLLLSLPEPQAMAVEKILSKALDSAINFAEKGFDGEGFVRRPEIPVEFKQSARVWVESGKPIAEFFTAVAPQLGKMEDYNVAEFVKAEEK